ncbi:MAG: Fe-S-containing protein [Dehalococcoidales bacterium]|nr:Fe-S-containing protein [Dehalococcoidales bacterium]
MNKKIMGIIGFIVMLSAALTLAACGNGTASAQGTAPTSKTTTQVTAAKGGTYAATTVTPTVNGDIVSIPAAAVNTSKNVEFNVKFDQGTASYMVYELNGALQMRASICVPCQGRSFTLKGNNLICNTCGTVFSAQTGKGISGSPACQNYPKAAVNFTTGADGSITANKADLLKAFTDTLTPGTP